MSVLSRLSHVLKDPPPEYAFEVSEAGIAWARPVRVFYAGTRDDAAAAGFDDARLWAELARAPANGQRSSRDSAP